MSLIDDQDFVTVKSKKKERRNKLGQDYILEESTWEISDVLMDMQDYCEQEAVFLLDKCDSYDFIEFIKFYTH